MMSERLYNRRKNGYTLGELLLAIGILLILFAIAVPAVFTIKRNLRQTELDAKAETIYENVQNRLSKMKASGTTAYIQPGDDTKVITLAEVPNDVNVEEDQINPGDIAYFTSTDLNTTDTAANVVMYDTSLENSLVNEHWVIEFNPSSAIVYAVFYSEDLASCNEEYVSDYKSYDTSYRYKEKRLKAGAKVGYYGGGSAEGSSQVTEITPSLTVVNAEKLAATITCTIPKGVSDEPVFKIEMEDTAGNVYTAYYAPDSISSEYQARIKDEVGNSAEFIVGKNIYGEEMQRSGRTYALNLILDDLTDSSTRFVNRYGSGSNPAKTQKLLSGTPLKITVTAMCPGNKEITATHTDSVITNSLFADDNCTTTDKTVLNKKYGSDENNSAMIIYGRHLQNLDDVSGVIQEDQVQSGACAIKYAKQSTDIDFEEDDNQIGYYDWYETYGKNTENATLYFNGNLADNSPDFKPIHNSALLSFDGDHHLIQNLREEKLEDTTKTDHSYDQGDLGLFSSIGETATQTLKNINLVRSRILGDHSTGALAGSVTGNATIESCQVYLSGSDLQSKSNKYIWINGENAGGLIGIITNGSVKIINSSASTVIGGYSDDAVEKDSDGNISSIDSFDTSSVGGLIGKVSDDTLNTTIYISKSYADNYLAGTNAGGLVGDTVELAADHMYAESCYAAGFMSYISGAGMVYGNATMKNCYTIMDHLYLGNDTNYYSTSIAGTIVDKVYYYAFSTNEQFDLDATTPIDNKTSKQMVQAFGEAAGYTEASAGSTFYNLMGQSITSYDYPVLSGLHHYGDWNASFQVGGLVYYEVYEDSDGNLSYGFSGANVDVKTLKDSNKLTVIGDGYGIIYRETDTKPSSLYFEITDSSYNETLDIIGGTSYTVTNSSVTYEIYPLDKKICNMEDPSEDFYLKATIKASESATIGDYYYFNPHFAKTVIKMGSSDDAVPSLDDQSKIYVRSARHLYMLSLYYDTYAEVTEPCTYLQERNIEYTNYEWGDFSTRTESNPKSQGPIAEGKTAFTSTYNGQCYWITDVSFVSKKGTYVGFIGNNNGVIKNVVLTSRYKEDGSNYNVRRESSIQANTTVYLGVLTGLNGKNGKISNCAVAGYYISGADGTLFAYNNSKLKAGGLVGENQGKITKCSADTPIMRVSSNYANTLLGGFVGNNTGQISKCYALGDVNVIFSKGGSVSIAGFAADNQGTIENSYCATALNSSGDTCVSYGFAPSSGKISGCQYLNNGSYSYIGHLHAFSFDKGAGNSASYNDLRKNGKKASAKHSYDFQNTITDTDDYPFAAVVTDSDGDLVHYGDWIDDEKMGSAGIFYWEHEENGTNNGYHFTYLGNNSGKTTGGTSLCNSHDDGGVITEYGYGYFEKNQGSVKSLSMSGSTINGQSSVSTSSILSGNVNYNKKASDSLNDQIHYTYVDSSTGETVTGNYYFYAFTTQTKSDAGTGEDYLCMNSSSEANCTWTLKYSVSDGSSSSEEFKYELCPFFANSMQILSDSDSYKIKGADGNKTDYSMEPGLSDTDSSGSGNPYEIRSIKQLQFINWKIASTYATSYSNYNFTYEDVYSEYSGYNSQSAHDFPYECTSDYLTANTQKHFFQTHDINNESTSGTIDNFYPLGKDGRSFKGNYNGNSYQIKNLKITVSSMCYVGLFGEVGGGTSLTNIILNADQGKGLIESSYNASTYSEPVVGSLVGMEWVGSGQSSQITINNCASSGYTVRYSGKISYSSFYRYMSIGGLIGSCFSAEITNCSAANTVQIKASDTNTLKYCQQMGGLIGSAGKSQSGSTSGVIKNCYSGGKIVPDQSSSTAIYLCGGLIGNAAADVSNHNLNKDKCSISNSYSYCEVPDSHYRYDSSGNLSYSSGTEVNNRYCLAGNSSTSNQSNTYYLKRENKEDSDPNAKAKSYGEMSSSDFVSTMGSSFSKVTVTEGSSEVRIDGKYSFPVSSVLEGKNYPFPAVVSQKDIVFDRTVKVHYGDWPVETAYWENARDSMDFFADMQSDSYAEKEFKLYLNNQSINTDAILSEDGTIATILTVGEQQSDETGTYLPVTVRAVNTGTTTIQVADSDISFTLEVTADINVSADPDSLLLATDQSDKIKLHALDANAKDFATSESASWSVESDKSDIIEFTQNKNVLTVLRDDEGDCTLTVTLIYNYHDVNIIKNLYVDVLQANTVCLSASGSTKEKQYVYTSLNSEDINQSKYITPEKGNLYLAGWAVSGTDQIVMKDYSGNLSLTGGIDGYTDENGKWIYDGDCTLEAVWTEGNKITLINGDDEVYTENIVIGSTSEGLSQDVSTLSMSKPADDYTLEGWYTTQNLNTATKILDASGQICAELSGYTKLTDGSYQFDLSQNQKLYACWINGSETSFGKTFLVQYDSNGGGEVTPSSENVIVDGYGNAAVTLPSAPAAPDHKNFAGWKVEEGETYDAGESVTITSDTTFVAQWKDSIKITFHTSNSSAKTTSYDYTNEDVVTISVDSLSGYDFDGWVDEDGNLVFDADGNKMENLTSDIDLYARWKDLTFTKYTPSDTSQLTEGVYLIKAYDTNYYMYGNYSKNNKIDRGSSNNYPTDTYYYWKVDSAGHIEFYNSVHYLKTTNQNIQISQNSNAYSSVITSNANDASVWSYTYSSSSGYGYLKSGNYYFSTNNQNKPQFQFTSTAKGIILYKQTIDYKYASGYPGLTTLESFSSAEEPVLSSYQKKSYLSSEASTDAHIVETEEISSVSVTLMNGSSIYQETEIHSGDTRILGYTAPKRVASSWKLDGWYTSKSSSGKKILNAKGVVTENDVENYCQDGKLTAKKDITLYACWKRVTDAYVKADTLEDQEKYLLTCSVSDHKRVLKALGGLVYEQDVILKNPSDFEYKLYDKKDGKESKINGLILTNVPSCLVWSSYNGELEIQTNGNYTVSIQYNGNNHLKCFKTDAKCYKDIGIYHRIDVLQRTFDDEELSLTLCDDYQGKTYQITVIKGQWKEISSYEIPVKDGYEFLGWYDSLDEQGKCILDEDGNFNNNNISGYVKHGKWINKSDNLTLFAKWKKVKDEESGQ